MSNDDKPVFIFHAVKSVDIPYFSVSRGFAQDAKLSYEAAGLLLYLQSKPDTWRVIPSTLQRVKCGKNRVYVLLKELIERGYVRREIFRGERGRVEHVAYYVYPASQLPINQETEKQEHDNHNPENSDIRNKRVGRDKKEKQLPAVQDDNTTPEKITGDEWGALLVAIEEVFKAHGSEAINYANMLTGRAKLKGWKAGNITPPVQADELRTWWKWYKQANPGVTQVKKPELVFSAITEFRKVKTPVHIVTRPPLDLARMRPTVTSGVINPIKRSNGHG